MMKKLLKNLRINSIQFLITLSGTLITIAAMLFVGGTLYSRFLKSVEENATTVNEQVINQVSFNLERYQDTMINISDLLENTITHNKDLESTKLEEVMNMLLETRDDIVTLAIFSEDGTLMKGKSISELGIHIDIKKQNWFEEVIGKSNKVFFSSPHVQHLFKTGHNWVISLSRQITFQSKGKDMKGILLVDMNFRVIEELCQNVDLGGRSYIYVLDSNGNIVYHPRQQLIYAGVKEEDTAKIMGTVDGSFMEDYQGEQRLNTVKTIRPIVWKIVGVSYMDEIAEARKEMNKYVGQVLIVGILFVISISVSISYQISKPIRELEKSMELVKEGQFDVQIDIKGEDEVVQLSKTFNLMVARIRSLMHQIVQEQESKRKSELNALQAQINPHFLYNTLDSIVWMAENGNQNDVIDMVTALARLFRISISKGKHIITVKEELEHAKNYLIIQKVRYKNKFQYAFQVDESLLHYKTLKLILQPIIENAIYHGIEYMVDEGLIMIKVLKDENRLLFVVEDNGLGMTQEKLQSILSRESKKAKGSGVGVKNVHERIQLYFGKEYGLEYYSELEEGTTVKIWLPLVGDEKQQGVKD